MITKWRRGGLHRCLGHVTALDWVSSQHALFTLLRLCSPYRNNHPPTGPPTGPPPGPPTGSPTGSPCPQPPLPPEGISAVFDDALGRWQQVAPFRSVPHTAPRRRTRRRSRRRSRWKRWRGHTHEASDWFESIRDEWMDNWMDGRVDGWMDGHAGSPAPAPK